MGITSIPATKGEALQQGSTRFFTGKPCRNGHIAPRYTKASSMCVSCSEDAYLRNRDTRREQNKARYTANAQVYRTKELQRNQDNPKGYWARNALKSARNRANDKNLPFNLTLEHIENIMPDVCPVFGTEFVFFGAGITSVRSPSLDRLRPELGYVEGNVRVISLKANNIKSSATAEEVLKVVRWMQEQGL